MSKAYLLVFCLLTASFTGCLGFGDGDDKGEENIDDIIDKIEEDTNNGNNIKDDEAVTKEKDSDNDGIIDSKDAFPYDKNETLDSDNDGVGDNSDQFPNNSDEWLDSDGDGLGNNYENILGTDANNSDTDGDSISDFDEVENFATNPLTNDSDSDNIDDWSEINGWISNGYEWITNPLVSDSDGDGVSDYVDIAPTGDAVLHIVFLYWSVSDAGQDFWSLPDPWLRIQIDEDEIQNTASWDNSLEWQGELNFEFDIKDDDSTIGIAIELWDSDSETTQYPETESSQIMDISPEAGESSLVLYYSLAKSNYCFQDMSIISCEEREDTASGLERHNLAEIEAWGGDDGGSSYEYDSYIYFGLYWEVKNDINLPNDFYEEDADGDTVPDYLDYNDEMDVGLTITLEDFGIASNYNEYINVEVFIDGDSRYFLGQTGDALYLEGGRLYEFDESFFVDIDDSKRFCVIQIIAYSTGWLFSSNYDLDGHYDYSNVLTIYYYTNTDELGENYDGGYAYGADDPGEDYDLDAMLYYSIEVTDTAEYGVQKTFEWIYDGKTYTHSMQLDPETYYYFKSLDHDITDEENWPDMYTRFVTSTEDYVVELANDLDSMSNNEGFNDIQTINFILSFVQTIDYKLDNFTTYSGIQEYPKYPVEMLWDGQGDCEDASALFASLMEAMGFDAVLIILHSDENNGGHAAVGVSHNDAVGTYYELNDKKYFFTETTSVGWMLGDYPFEELRTAYIYDI